MKKDNEWLKEELGRLFKYPVIAKGMLVKIVAVSLGEVYFFDNVQPFFNCFYSC